VRHKAKFRGDRSWKPLLRYGDFSIFQNGRRPSSLSCYTRFGTTHEEYLVVLIVVQNLVGMDTVASIMQVVIFCEFGT